MVKVFLASGYNSYTNKQLTRAFLVPTDAEQFLGGLTDPKFKSVMASSYIALINDLLKGEIL
jgi:hypothetical protein